ncbi:hypothetical protein D9M72_407630 [compost metagenome]
MRALVHEPMKTLSSETASIGVFGSRPMYCSACSMLLRRTGSRSSRGSGMRSPIATTISGEVPQVTCGQMVAASRSTTASNAAPGSLRNVRQYSTAASHMRPCGAWGRPPR